MYKAFWFSSVVLLMLGDRASVARDPEPNREWLTTSSRVENDVIKQAHSRPVNLPGTQEVLYCLRTNTMTALMWLSLLLHARHYLPLSFSFSVFFFFFISLSVCLSVRSVYLSLSLYFPPLSFSSSPVSFFLSSSSSFVYPVCLSFSFFPFLRPLFFLPSLIFVLLHLSVRLSHPHLFPLPSPLFVLSLSPFHSLPLPFLPFVLLSILSFSLPPPQGLFSSLMSLSSAFTHLAVNGCVS